MMPLTYTNTHMFPVATYACTIHWMLSRGDKDSLFMNKGWSSRDAIIFKKSLRTVYQNFNKGNFFSPYLI